jgi:hypothetical protein
MDIFQRFRRQQPQQPPQQGLQPVEGLLGYFHLGDWWLRMFTPTEREHIEFMYVPLGSTARPLTQGRFTYAPQSAADFLSNLGTVFEVENPPLAERIRAKVIALGGEPYPGYLNGRRYSSYAAEVTQLRRDGDLVKAEQLLLALIATVETEARIKLSYVAPWYYEELAKLYRHRQDYAAELAVIERYKHQPHGADSPDDDVLKREAKARELLSRAHDRK